MKLEKNGLRRALKQKAPQCGAFCRSQDSSARDFFEHFEADFPLRNFAQGRYTGLVLAFDFCGMSLTQHACPVRGRQHQLEAVRDFF